jgi:polygalacturonase
MRKVDEYPRSVVEQKAAPKPRRKTGKRYPAEIWDNRTRLGLRMLRRDFLATMPLALSIATVGRGLAAPAASVKSILQFGAKPDGRTLNTRAIQRAIDEVFQAGGGTVNVPAGTFLTGRVELRSRVTLNLEAGSTLLGSTSLGDYNAESSFAENHGANPRHLIFAQDADDVTLTGPGRIDGQGPTFWEPSGREPLPPDEQWADVASHSLVVRKGGRPSPMLEFVNCRRLKIESVHIENAPGWTLRTVNCDQVDIHGITIKNPTVGPNTDGLDITGCQNVGISNCSIDTGDDAICLKSENPYGSEPRLLKNIAVSHCVLTTCCNGFKLGTSSEGGFENITFSDSVVRNDAVDFKNRVISGIALEVVDGGWIDGVVVTGIQMERTRTPIFIRLENRKPPRDSEKHGLRNVRIENVQATEALLASSITGLQGSEVQDVTLAHMHIENVLPGRREWVGRAVPEKETAYPEARMFGMLPASGLYVRHARDLRLNDLVFTAPAGEPRPTVIFDDVNGARVTGLKSTPVAGRMPILQQTGSHNVAISDATTGES